jgi:wyosine [tRNA(Phe)-imidazoG37] synthetase (radical SAM superfamily)
VSSGTDLGCLRNFLSNRFVYVLVSPRAKGLSMGINVNPDKQCNFNCAYCEVDRRIPGEPILEIETMAAELQSTLQLVRSGELLRQPAYQKLTPELAQLRHVALSGDGEPTISEKFLDVVQTVIHLRAKNTVPFFKVVLITNASRLADDTVCAALSLFTTQDDIWAKLDGGSQAYLNQVNAPDLPLEQILSNIASVAQVRPIVIQSLFPLLNGEGPDAFEISAYIDRLKSLQQRAAKISLVQIYSANRPPANHRCGHLSLKALSSIAQAVRRETGLNAQVF